MNTKPLKDWAQELANRMYGQKEKEDNMAIMDSAINDLQNRFREAFTQQKRQYDASQQKTAMKVTELEGYLMELNVALSSVALAIASGNFEKVRACVEGLEKAQKPIEDYFRKKIDTKFDGVKEEAADRAPFGQVTLAGQLAAHPMVKVTQSTTQSAPYNPFKSWT